MRQKHDPEQSSTPPEGLQRVRQHLRQQGQATLRGLKRMTFRDWMQVAAIPISVALLGLFGTFMTIFYNQQQNESGQEQHVHDIQITQDQQREAALQTYFDRMSDLILNGHLKTTTDSEMRYVARTRTLNALSQLDGIRKGEIMRFLNDTDLIRAGSPIVDLSNADLSQADLVAINLRDADLRNVSFVNANLQFAQMHASNLSNADLSQTNLNGADLSLTNLSNDDLSSANLKGTNLSQAKGLTMEQLHRAKSLQGTILPDGSRHR